MRMSVKVTRITISHVTDSYHYLPACGDNLILPKSHLVPIVLVGSIAHQRRKFLL